MEATNDRILIYDEECPLCKWYTGKFVQYGMLNKEQRLSFMQIEDKPLRQKLDLDRAYKEIPLVDPTGGKTLYGVDSLVYILKRKIPFLKPLIEVRWLRWVAQGLYFFVSYNRRIFAPTDCDTACGDPGLSRKHRFALMAVAALVATATICLLGAQLDQLLGVADNNLSTVLPIVIGEMWILPFAVAFQLPVRQRFDYWGHLSVIMLLGALLLLPWLWLNTLLNSPILLLFGLVTSSGLMTAQHVRRIRTMRLPQTWTLGWFIAVQIAVAAILLLFLKFGI